MRKMYVSKSGHGAAECLRLSFHSVAKIGAWTESLVIFTVTTPNSAKYGTSI